MTKEYTLKTLFSSGKISSIEIPRIQRDYAQGRQGKIEDRIRSSFLETLYKAIQEKRTISLDFVYGDVNEGKLTLLDGQQRLTTLFLLHWYAAKKEKIEKNEYNFLENFSYDTRFSSRVFCKAIIENEIDFNAKKLSDEIKDQPWYPYDWKNDPTIQSMLVMIDAIHNRFSGIKELWLSLTVYNYISFYFLSLKEMGLTDELYIKMNSRGKPLTVFEHFKAEFLEIIKENDEDRYKKFSRKIDIDWTNMLFQYRDENQIIDNEFMRYFKFISHIICYESDISPEYDEFELVNSLYSKKNKNSLKNLESLEKAFDCWCNIDIDSFFNKFFYLGNYERGKTKLYLKGEEKPNLFLNCCKYHAEFSENGRNRLFSLNDILLFYAVLIYKLNHNSISEEDFKRRIRIVRNLIENSQNEIREYNQDNSNQMKNLLNDVDEIIKNGNISAEERGFNILQKQEEKQKLAWVQNNEIYKDELFQLEDSDLLKGTISIIGINNPQNFTKFRILFRSCDKDLISKALLTKGDYSQNLRWRTQLGVKTRDTVWADLFHLTKQRNEQGRFQNTSELLNSLLSAIPDNCSDYKKNLEEQVLDYLNSSERKSSFDWRYYFIKYEQMRYDNYGMYWWNNKKDKPYEIIIMHTEQRLTGRNWNIFAYTLKELHSEIFDLGDYAYQGDKLQIKGTNINIDILNDKFVISEGEKEIIIPQNESGNDTVDRIDFIYNELKSLKLLNELPS